jgi:hypothetical protein
MQADFLEPVSRWVGHLSAAVPHPTQELHRHKQQLHAELLIEHTQFYRHIFLLRRYKINGPLFKKHTARAQLPLQALQRAEAQSKSPPKSSYAASISTSIAAQAVLGPCCPNMRAPSCLGHAPLPSPLSMHPQASMRKSRQVHKLPTHSTLPYPCAVPVRLNQLHHACPLSTIRLSNHHNNI